MNIFGGNRMFMARAETQETSHQGVLTEVSHPRDGQGVQFCLILPYMGLRYNISICPTGQNSGQVVYSSQD